MLAATVRRLSITAALLAVGVTAAHADVASYATYTSTASFAAAAGSTTTYTFPEGDGSFNGSPYLLGPVGIGSTSHIVKPHVMSDGFYGAGVNYLNMSGPLNGINVAIQNPSGIPIYAMAFDLGTYYGADTLTLVMNYYDTVGTFTTPAAGQSTWIGITSLVPIVQVKFLTTTGSEIDLLDVTVGTNTIAAVPEASTSAMALAGLAGIGAIVRRRRRTV